ncbi:MAG: hypothetical protein ACOYD7_05475, partial [Raoultibacter sp.]
MFMVGTRSADSIEIKKIILSDDLVRICRALEQSPPYDFGHDLKTRLDTCGLSVSEFARRCGVSHTIARKWLSGSALPKGKERLKEIGMALVMREDELDAFLLENNYMPLYAKNPFDLVAKYTLYQASDASDLVNQYHTYLTQFGIAKDEPIHERRARAIHELSESFNLVFRSSDAKEWFDNHRDMFSANERWIIPSKELIRFLLLYLDESSIHEMYVNGKLPVSVRNLLYPISREEEVTTRGLRNKLIVFGICQNMCERELDKMLEFAKLRAFTDARTAVEIALLTAVRIAHERYPLYELASIDKRCSLLSSAQENSVSKQELTSAAEELTAFYMQEYDNVSARAEYYLKPGKRGEEEKFFELYYTDYAERGLIDYVYDVLVLLRDSEALPEKESNEFVGLLKRRRFGLPPFSVPTKMLVSKLRSLGLQEVCSQASYGV